MQAAKLRLVVAACLFLGWIGWLAYLVIISRDEIILSEPQFLLADLWVLADVREKDDAPAAEVTLSKVIWPAKPDPDPGLGPLTISGLPEITADEGWEGPGRYVLPLTREKRGTSLVYRVTFLPPRLAFASQQPVQGAGKPRIYFAGPEVVEQVNDLRAKMPK
jgi:hypothetical protein